jgi:hypothetical protein
MEMQSDTVVTGVVQDQAALHGLLERIRDLGLELLDVHQVSDAEARGQSKATDP